MIYGNGNDNNKNNLMVSGIQLINLFIGIILTLVCILVYITVKSLIIKYIIIGFLIITGLIIFISLLIKSNKKLNNHKLIKTIALVNEEDEIIKEWKLLGKISMIIGKEDLSNEVDIDLSGSVYSNLIEDEHAVLNYAGGTWYVEDLYSNNGVSIRKIEDGIQYRVEKYSPCKIKKGDTLFIGKTKLLLR